METPKKKKKAGVSILISEKVGFRKKKIARDKEKFYINGKECVYQEYLTILNVSGLNNIASKDIRQNPIKLKGEIDKYTTNV